MVEEEASNDGVNNNTEHRPGETVKGASVTTMTKVEEMLAMILKKAEKQEKVHSTLAGKMEELRAEAQAQIFRPGGFGSMANQLWIGARRLDFSTPSSLTGILRGQTLLRQKNEQTPV